MLWDGYQYNDRYINNHFKEYERGLELIQKAARLGNKEANLFIFNYNLNQEKGKEIQILKKGDVVKIPPNVEHWHGAAPDSDFAHISIEQNLPNNQTTWLDPVTDKEYK